MGDACPVFAAASPIDGALAPRVEGFPGDAGGIVDPGFLGLGITAGRLALLDDGTAGLAQARIDFPQFVAVLDLDAQVIEAGLAPPRRDREVDARVVEHPLCVV